jgi:hypothetical protein
VSDPLSRFTNAVRNHHTRLVDHADDSISNHIFRTKPVVALPQTSNELTPPPGTPHRDAPTMLREQRQWDARDGGGANRGREGDSQRGVDALSDATGMPV